LCATLFTWQSNVFAQDYPNRVVRIIVPYAAGGSTDIPARLIAKRLNEKWSQPVLVENRAGAGGNIGTASVARAPADGYTLLLATNAQSANQSLFKNLTFHILNDFSAVSLVATVTNVLVANPKFETRSVQALIERARSKPGELSYASAGAGSAAHLYFELLKKLTGTDFRHIPYSGGATAVADVIAGHVPLIITVMPTALPLIQAGKLQAMAVTTNTRSRLLPNTPTLAESGVPGFDARAWFGLLAPAGTPPSVISRLNKDVVDILREPESIATLAAAGYDVATSTPQEFGTYFKAEVQKWGDVIKSSGATAE
jgi:tripartite-type tricarboxylate transporter receptor subunit TctC